MRDEGGDVLGGATAGARLVNGGPGLPVWNTARVRVPLPCLPNCRPAQGDPSRRSASNDVVTSIIRSDCYRPERQLPGGIRTRWGMAPCHGAPERLLLDTQSDLRTDAPEQTSWRSGPARPRVTAPDHHSHPPLELQGAQARPPLPNGPLGPAEPIGELDQAAAAMLPVERRG